MNATTEYALAKAAIEALQQFTKTQQQTLETLQQMVKVMKDEQQR